MFEMKNTKSLSLIKILIKEAVTNQMMMNNNQNNQEQQQSPLPVDTTNQQSPSGLPTNQPLQDPSMSGIDQMSTQNGQVPVDPSSPAGPMDINDPGSSNNNPNGPQEDEPPKDPKTDIIDTAKEISKKTKSVSTTLKAVKAKMQDNYKEINNPTDIINSLIDTKDQVLINVADRLKVFLRAGK